MEEITIRRPSAYSEAPPRTAGRAVDPDDVGGTGEFTPVATTRITRRPPHRPANRREKTATLTSPETRAALRSHWNNAKAAAAALVQAAATNDKMEVALSADKLEGALTKLWELRASRDLDWQTILNHVQGMLRQVFLQKRAEELTVEQGKCIYALVEHCIGPATKSADDLNEAIRLIIDAGFDPYAAISGDPSGESEESKS